MPSGDFLLDPVDNHMSAKDYEGYLPLNPDPAKYVTQGRNYNRMLQEYAWLQLVDASLSA